ncbi:DUF3037 domain-containing protein [Patulibacter minatonensis]|uniref:DUF3037 domain-containing protein n=1 Tax=Patulibacter minatonensis TaxID=298163 RepID=UPI0004B623DD|nr:DUF3037 domain-containing protein [Patulibacter minatonensis]
MPGPPERNDEAGPVARDRADARGADAEARPDAAPSAAGSGTDEVFQYAVLRVVPSMTRGEGLNVGVVLHARRHRFLGLRVVVDPERLRALDPTLDLDALQEHLHGLLRVAEGDPAAGAIAAMPRSDRFGWLAAPSNTIVQPSPVHTGLCADAAATLDRLVTQLVVVP